jgi:hypothetical protein
LLVLVLLLLGAVLGLAAQTPGAEHRTPVEAAFLRLYNFDFPGAHALLDREIQRSPQDPLPLNVRAAAYLFAELHRLKILEVDFFSDDDRVVDRRKLKPDPAVRDRFFNSIVEAERLANGTLSSKPNDRDALFALCMATGLETDYAALVERRRFGSFSLSKQNQVYARKLLALDPPVYDAYLTFGTVEYVVGSLPFFLRWFVHMEQIRGSKEAAMEDLERAAKRGKYYGPLARMMMAVIHIREKRPRQAEALLNGLALEFPENPLFRRELGRLRLMQRPLNSQ